MKSLDQIASQGVALNTTNTPGDASNHFIISQPGSYYLTGNLVVTETNAIRITAAGAVIDLNGFQVSCTNATPGDGVTIRPGADHCTVKNGSFIGFGQGIDTITQSAKNCRFLDIAVSSCTNWGIRAGEGAVLESCRVHDCSGANAAIGAGVASTLRDCTASHNTTVNGIQALSGSSLINCTASNNTGTNAISAGNGSTLNNCAALNNAGGASGILTGDSCALVNCTVNANTVTNGFNIGNGCALNNCAATGNTGTGGINTGESNILTNCIARNNNVNNGILVGNGSSLSNCAASSNVGNLAISAGIATNDGCRIINCSAYSNRTNVGTATNSTGMGFNLGSDNIIYECLAYENKGDGIRVGTACRVLFSIANGSSGDCAGVHATGSNNLIEGNRVVINPRGIQIDGTGNFIIRNMVQAEFGYIIAANNVVGVIVNVPLSGAIGAPSYTGGAGLGTTDPWANFLQ